MYVYTYQAASSSSSTSSAKKCTQATGRAALAGTSRARARSSAEKVTELARVVLVGGRGGYRKGDGDQRGEDEGLGVHFWYIFFFLN